MSNKSWSFHLTQNQYFITKKFGESLEKVTMNEEFNKCVVFASLNSIIIKTKNNSIQMTFVEPRYSNIFILNVLKKEDLYDLSKICKFLELEDVFFTLIYKFISQIMTTEFKTITVSTFSEKIFGDFIETSFSKGQFYDNKETINVEYLYKCSSCVNDHISPISMVINPNNICLKMKKIDTKWLNKSFVLIKDSFEHFKEYFSKDIWELFIFSIVENIIEMQKIKEETNLLNNLLNCEGE